MARGFVVARQLLWVALTLGLSGCPNQELAPLVPCTVSIVSVDATQNGTDQVDLLFVIDSSASMSEEQVKLSAQLPHLVQVLTSGDFDGVPNTDGQLDFKPVGSLRLGVVSVDLGANGVSGVRSCGSNSYAATAVDTNAQGADSIDRPFGDDGLLLNSTDVAVMGVTVQNALGLGMATQAVAPRPECAVQLPRVLEYPSGGTPDQISTEFSCMAELGVNGCTVEQQLESMWKALAPSTDRSFSRGSGGQGPPMGLNNGFLRPEAILAVILVSDEEDCSSPDSSAQQIYGSLDILTINNQCGLPTTMLQPVERYINGLKSLKAPAFQDRIIFAGIVGVPLAATTRGESLEQILARPEMQFSSTNGLFGLQPRPVCTAPGGAGTATPARRMVEVAQGFAENGVITSICENDYGAALNAVISKIAGKLSGECLPRSLTRDAQGLVECRVVEIKAAGDASLCDPAAGRSRELLGRYVGGTLRRVCEMNQLAVRARMTPPGVGWYYDDFSNEVMRCQTNRQRIAFTPGAAIGNGASARFECYRGVATQPTMGGRGIEAVNTPCADTGAGGGAAKCRTLSTQDAPLVCVSGTCQLACMTDADCQPAFRCSASDGGTGYCVNPTCPQ